MDVREKLVELQSIITCPNAICNFCEHFKNKDACEKHKKEVIADNMVAHGVTVQSEIDAKTFQLMRECERLKEEKESLASAVNMLDEINSDLFKRIRGVTVQEWISVKDRLPDLELAEIKTDDNDLFPCLAARKHPRAKNGIFTAKVWYDGYGFIDGVSNDVTDEITHWMHLPQPPKGD